MTPLCHVAALALAAGGADLAAVRAGRQALADDAALADHTLAVSVRGGGAVVWGVAPTRELADRAVACVRLALAPLPVRDELLVVEPAAPRPRPAGRPTVTLGTVTSQFRPEGTPALPGVRLGDVGAAEPIDVAAAAATIRKTDGRFAGLAVEVDGGTARLGGKAAAWADVWDYAAAVGKLPGVTAVRVGKVSVGR